MKTPNIHLLYGTADSAMKPVPDQTPTYCGAEWFAELNVVKYLWAARQEIRERKIRLQSRICPACMVLADQLHPEPK